MRYESKARYESRAGDGSRARYESRAGDGSRVRWVPNPLTMLIAGLALGAVSRVLDIYTETLGNIFSGIGIWVLLGVNISIYSTTKKRAMLNILPFCIGLLITYYLVAMVTKGVYSWTFIYGWTVFALLTPVMAYFAWMTKERGAFPKVISAGIVAFSVAATVLLFDRLRAYDYVITGLLVYLLFFRKVERRS